VILIFGFRSMRKQLAVVFAMCRLCSRPCAHTVVKRRRWFTLFFIPMFPVGTTYFTVCSMCAGALSIDRDAAERLEHEARQQSQQPVQITPDGPLTPYGSVPAGPPSTDWSGQNDPPVPPFPPTQTL
jgi:hypothetical protein